jgi:hypothetical protein
MRAIVNYDKVVTEALYTNLPGPKESTFVMAAGELLHGFLSDL